MKNYRISFLFLLTLSLLVIQSCTEETDLVDVENSARGGRPGGGNGGNGGNEESIRNIDSEVVQKWNSLFLEVDRYATGMRPNATARALAYIHLTHYEVAVSGMRDYHSNQLLLSELTIDEDQKSRRIDYEIALNRAASVALLHFVPNIPNDVRNKIFQLEDEVEQSLRAGKSNRLIDDSKEWGEYVAQSVITYAQTDLEGEKQILDPQPHSYIPPQGAGYWTFSAEPERALFPYWETVRTFVISANQTTTVAPLAYSTNPNSEYFQQMMDVYTSNNTAKEQDNEDLWIAEFWSDDVENLMFSPPARQISIANQLIDQFNLDLEESLLLMLKTGFALNDAAVSTWKYKYEHMVMRPSVFVQEYIDPDYQTNLFRLIPWPNPTFPGYPSGHSAFASAAAGVFIDAFGDDVSFTDRSHEGRTEFRGMPRTFNTLSEMASENAYSRIPLGVHIEMDCTEGLRLGYEISNAVNQYDLRK